MAEKNETVDIEVDVPEEYGVLLYDTGRFSFCPGLNVLVGCNGTGKTTLMRLVADAVKTRPGAAVRMFSTVRESLHLPLGKPRGLSGGCFGAR